MTQEITNHSYNETGQHFAQHVSVLILSSNEVQNIARTLDALTSFPEVVVLDSCSTDATVEIARSYPNVRVVTRAFDRHATQWNYGLTACGIERPWILALDADYALSTSLVEEIDKLPVKTSVAGYRAKFRYCIQGRRLSAALYPPHVVLFQRQKARYVQEGHTQRVIIEGLIADLEGFIDHDDRKPLARWLQSQQKYARLEADHLLNKPQNELRRMDRLRLRGWAAPLLIPLYTLLVKRCLLDGFTGWYYVLQRTLAEIMIALEIGEYKLRKHSNSRIDKNTQCDLSTTTRTRSEEWVSKL